MSRPIAIANSINTEPLASPNEICKSLGAQQIVDSVCGSPIKAQHSIKIHSMNPKSECLSNTPEFHFNQFKAQGGKVIGQNTPFMFGTPPPQPNPCTCTFQNVVNNTSHNTAMMAAMLGNANNNFLWNDQSLFSQNHPPILNHHAPLGSQFLHRNLNVAPFNESTLLHQVQQSIRPQIQHPFTTFGSGESIVDDLLTRYRANPSLMKNLKLSDLQGNLLKFAKDQVGSRFIQLKLELRDRAENDAIFDEVIENAAELVDDIFGNYVVQKFFEYGEETHWIRLVDAILDRVPIYAFQMYACRVLQKALEKVNEPLQIKILAQIRHVILRCMKDQNGNHVIQKAIEKVSPKYIQFIVDTLLDPPSNIFDMSVDPYGCRVVQRVLEHCIPQQTSPIITHIHERFDEVANNQYGNYVVQHVIQHGTDQDRMIIVERVADNLLDFSTHKYSSNVIEKCLELGSIYHKGMIVRAACHQPEGEMPIVVQMMKDQYANYVVQKMFDQVTVDHRRELIMTVRPHIPVLRQYPHGKHILAKLEKYFIKQQVIVNYSYQEMPGGH